MGLMFKNRVLQSGSKEISAKLSGSPLRAFRLPFFCFNASLESSSIGGSASSSESCTLRLFRLDPSSGDAFLFLPVSAFAFVFCLVEGVASTS
jgi:hypothetical protein